MKDDGNNSKEAEQNVTDMLKVIEYKERLINSCTKVIVYRTNYGRNLSCIYTR